MIYAYAAVTTFAAGFLLRTNWVGHRSFASLSGPRGGAIWLALRLAAFAAVIVCGYQASGLFGEAGSGEAFLRMLAVLALPQFVLSDLFAFRPAPEAEPAAEAAA